VTREVLWCFDGGLVDGGVDGTRARFGDVRAASHQVSPALGSPSSEIEIGDWGKA
jgi:hypothetical protein